MARSAIRSLLVALSFAVATRAATTTVDAYGGSVSSVQNPATHVLVIPVGSLEDYPDDKTPGSCKLMPAVVGKAVHASVKASVDGAACTLREALNLANLQDQDIAVSIAVRSGRIRLAAPLPSVRAQGKSD